MAFDFSLADFHFTPEDSFFFTVGEFIDAQLELLYAHPSLIKRPAHSPSRPYLHSKRVAEDVFYMCRVLGLPEHVCENMLRATLLHDLGKLDVPLEIFDKPDRLTDEEYEEMKRHTLHGIKRIEALGNLDHPFMKLVLAVTRYHHEQYNGHGYESLKGDEIPHPIRLVVICDVFDAITGDRPYRRGDRQPSKHDVLLLMIDREKGMAGHFGPWLLRRFVEYKYPQIGYAGVDEKNKAIEAYLAEDPSVAAAELLPESLIQSSTQTS